MASRRHVGTALPRPRVEDDIHIAYHRQHLRAAVCAECHVLGERYDESGVIFRVQATPATIERLRTSAAEAWATLGMHGPQNENGVPEVPRLANQMGLSTA